MAKQHSDHAAIAVSSLSPRKPTTFALTPDSNARAKIAAALGLLELRKLRFEGRIEPAGKRDWQLEAALGATAVQPCVVTLDPVTTRIDTTVRRHYVADLNPEDSADEVEMPEDDSQEPLGEIIDLAALMQEALALALPDYPRSAAAASDAYQAAPPGMEPLRDEDMKPFAGLASLKQKMDRDG